MKSFFKIGFVALVAILAMSFTFLAKNNVLGKQLAKADVPNGCYTSVTIDGSGTAPAGQYTAFNPNGNTTNQTSACDANTTLKAPPTTPPPPPINYAISQLGVVTGVGNTIQQEDCTAYAQFCCYEVFNNRVTSVCYKTQS